MSSKISTYIEAVDFIKQMGFMPLSKNPFGIPSLEDITLPENWHTGQETDPWIWKDRIALEKVASYAKVMNKRPSFISTEWYPYFLAVYRPAVAVEDGYTNGTVSNTALEVYQCLQQNAKLATHELKERLGINKENKSKFESGLVELQVNMKITVFGASKKINKQGESYGWPVTEYTTVENWAGNKILEDAAKISRKEALDRIVAKTREMSPGITDKDICKFLGLKKLD